MKKICYSLLVILLCSHWVIAQGDVAQARWQSAKIITDGNNNEWRKPLNLYDAITGLLFTIANDSTNLYLCFIDNDERKVAKLMKAGWSVEVYSKDKNKKFNAVIIYPAVQMISAPGKDAGVANSDQPEFKNETSLYRLNTKTVKSTGFVTANGDMPVSDSSVVRTGIGSDNTQAIIYEIAIPFKELFPGNVQLNEELGLHITVNKLKKEPYRGDPDGKDLVGKGGFGGGRKNGRSAGASQNSVYPVDRSLLYTEIDFKQRFKLAGK